MADETPTTDSDPGLLDALAEPDDAARAERLTSWLSDQYRNRLRLFANRRLRDPASAEDVVQEALQTVLKALRAGRVRDPASIAAFAFEAVRNLCMHRGRSQGREARVLEVLATSPPPAPPDVLTAIISKERRQAVRAALGHLSEDDRLVLELTYKDLRDSEDIGRELGLTAGAVRVRRHRALSRLAAFLDVTIGPEREQD